MNEGYDHYIAVDWSIGNMAIARMTGKSNKITVVDVPSDVSELKLYLKNLRGRKALTLEETTTSQWLYTELKGEVDRLLICDPVRNHLLSEGAKTDKIDASKLVQLLRANGIYHELIVIPDAVHETLLHSRWLDFFARMEPWLDKYLRKAEKPPVTGGGPGR